MLYVCVYVYVCICVCVYVCIYVYVYMYMYMCVCVYKHIFYCLTFKLLLCSSFAGILSVRFSVDDISL